MRQREKLLQFIVRYCAAQGSRTFELGKLVRTSVVEDVGISGGTPRSTLRRLLQELRDDGKILFNEIGRGYYTLLHHPILEGEIVDEGVSRISSEQPDEREYLMETYARNRGWVKKAKERLGLYCQMPGCSNTFTKKASGRRGGEPYIEVHHIVPLYQGGEDGLWNLAVVCAHHHRMAHFADDHTKRLLALKLRQMTEERILEFNLL